MRMWPMLAVLAMLASAHLSEAQDAAGGIETLGSDDDFDYVDVIEVSSPEEAQELVQAFAPYGIDLNAPAPAIEAETEALSPEQAEDLAESILEIFASPDAAPEASPAASPTATGRRLKI